MTLYASVNKLVEAPCDHNNKKDAHNRGNRNRQPLSRYHIEVQHQSHARRHEKERHILYQETAHRRYLVGTDRLALKQAVRSNMPRILPGIDSPGIIASSSPASRHPNIIPNCLAIALIFLSCDSRGPAGE